MPGDLLKRLAGLYKRARPGSVEEERARALLLQAASQELTGHPVEADYDARSEVRRVMADPDCVSGLTVLRDNGTS